MLPHPLIAFQLRDVRAALVVVGLRIEQIAVGGQGRQHPSVPVGLFGLPLHPDGFQAGALVRRIIGLERLGIALCPTQDARLLAGRVDVVLKGEQAVVCGYRLVVALGP